MGDQNISTDKDRQQAQVFMKALLADVTALEYLLDNGLIESGIRRIGAEQEMFLVDKMMRPAPVALSVLGETSDERLTTEIGKFNLEANLTPRLLSGQGLSDLEHELHEVYEIVRKAAEIHGDEILLTGVLPTLRQSDLTLDNITPKPRYYELNRVIKQLRGGSFFVQIKGLDELQMMHDNVMLEAACTSFQIHLQVGPEEFAKYYNMAQAVSAPVLAVATNSPYLMGRRLWHETRIPFFQHSVDERSDTHQGRNRPTRVSFGDNWIHNSIMEIFHEEIARFRVVLTKQIEEDPMEIIRQGGLPTLDALRLHNGTVWRWNRPCYGVSEGKAHLRIEHRSLPSGPTIIDEMANAAFFFGLMSAMPEEYGEIDKLMSFDDAKYNFFAAARHGLKAQLTWINGRDLPASTLVLEHLLPLAREGLRSAGADTTDSNRYLDIIEERVRGDQTGSFWFLRSLSTMPERSTREIRLRALTENMLEQQQSGIPVHLWSLARLNEFDNWSFSFQTVGQFMSTDLFTVRPDDLVDLAASVMGWKHIRHVPVEDDQGLLIGLISHRDLLKLLAQGLINKTHEPLMVKDIMTPSPVTVTSDTPTIDALRIMRQMHVGCLPVVENNKLIGIVTAHDFLSLSSEILERQLKETASEKA
ncbi:MAG: CBS domain-containing protein [Acidobacteria bacterium]|nr:CBS domain-containing protein [Acidobacteriota bacterium]